jgi:hypothetical protein
MKKLFVVFSLSLVFILSGCNPFYTHCTLTGPPNAPYRLVYPCIAPCGPIPTTASGNVKPDGTFRVPQLGWGCSGLQALVRFGTVLNVALTASPSSVYLPGPPASGTITGQSFDATYGPPRVDYFDNNGYLLGSVYATAISSDGTSLQANMPDLSYVYSGTYQVKVTNMTYDGYYLNIVGSATMTGWGRDRPDSDGDGWYDDEDCDPYDPFLNYNCVETCGGDGIRPIEICQPIY